MSHRRQGVALNQRQQNQRLGNQNARIICKARKTQQAIHKALALVRRNNKGQATAAGGVTSVGEPTLLGKQGSAGKQGAKAGRTAAGALRYSRLLGKQIKAKGSKAIRRAL